MNAEPEDLRCLNRAVDLRASIPRWPGRLMISNRLSPSCATGEWYLRSTTCPGFAQLTALRRSLAIIRRTAESASAPLAGHPAEVKHRRSRLREWRDKARVSIALNGHLVGAARLTRGEVVPLGRIGAGLQRHGERSALLGWLEDE